MFASTPEIPSWVQFPKRDFHENMMVQFTEGLPGLVQADDRVTFDSSTRLTSLTNSRISTPNT